MPPKDYRKECQGSSCRLQLTVVFDRVQFKSRMRRLHSVLVPRHFNLDFIKRHRWNRSGLLSWNRSSTHSCFSHCIPHLKLSSLWSDCVQKKLQQRKKKQNIKNEAPDQDPHMWIRTCGFWLIQEPNRKPPPEKNIANHFFKCKSADRK